MMPFDFSFRHMLIKYIPHIDDKKLNDHESIFANCDELQHDITIIPEKYLVELQNAFERYRLKKIRSVTQRKKILQRTKEEFEQEVKNNYQIPIKSDLENKINNAAKILRSYQTSYDAAHKLWAARRKLAFEQGSFFQIRPSFKGIIRFITCTVEYWIIKIQTLPLLWLKKIKLHLKSYWC